ncbi:hypothetical protein TraAM80_09986 [Trypanosoma rangeli]|uniref:Uncharacterized protein n=1 Tax=Trypanosoma rangeli TaxID=5698 RepID=A0A422MSF4_TRYRA|nr:uncharacterized protein TraAM80_09986 [Trypanosoma rangeli]RNE96165.1 hypothetical protein TraAM80_09986 [Trypanosoma rangeli]|eukprot:RNE96165.1 hypothetical protein TraAM80_09986 [Trypanosoma rangeli]
MPAAPCWKGGGFYKLASAPTPRCFAQLPLRGVGRLAPPTVELLGPVPCVRACDRHLLLSAGASRTVNWAVGMMRRVSAFLLGRVLTPEAQTALHLLCPELALYTIHGV